MFSNNLFDAVVNGTFLYGFNPGSKVDKRSYKKYVSFTSSITEVLKDYDINIKNKGYAYIVDAVMLIMDQNKLDIKLIDDVYPYIKMKYELNSISAVEHSIRNAIKSAYQRRHRKARKSRMNEHAKKPSNKKFLLWVTQEVIHKMCNEFLISGN